MSGCSSRSCASPNICQRRRSPGRLGGSPRRVQSVSLIHRWLGERRFGDGLIRIRLQCAPRLIWCARTFAWLAPRRMTAPGLTPACKLAVKTAKASVCTKMSNSRGSSASCEASNDRSEASEVREAAESGSRGPAQSSGRCPTQHLTLQPISFAIAAVLFEHMLSDQKKALSTVDTEQEPRPPPIWGLFGRSFALSRCM